MYGEKIRLVREVRGFSQEYMAAKLGLAQNTYSNIETNKSKITAEMLENIAKEFQSIVLEYVKSHYAPTAQNLGEELIKNIG